MNKPTQPVMKRFILFILLVFIVGTTWAQDLHYSQFYNSPLNINPAKTGIFNGDKRFNLSYRNQWTSIVPWTTFSGSYDMKFYPKKDRKYFFSGGALLNYDNQSRIADLSLFNLNLTGSYTYIINDQNLFTGGLLLGFANRAFDPTSLTWDGQWNGRNFDATGPQEFLNVEGVSFMESGLGLNYRWQKTNRTKLDLGLGIYHLFQPNIAFDNTDSSLLPRRFSLTGEGNFMVAQKLDIQLQAMAQFQGDYREYQFGGLGKIYVNQNRGKELEVHVGLGYRTSKSLFPIFAVQYKNFYASINYDIDLSGFSGSGPHPNPQTLELHFNYIITNVKPFKKVKVCPIF
jgi:type IX secretion system PorP/SprF family membrane protein